MNDVLRMPALRVLLAAYLVFKAAEWGTWIAVLIYAYDADGAAAVGIVAAAQLLPAALLAPLGPAFVTRVAAVAGRSSPLSAAYGIQALAVSALAAAVLITPSLVVYGFAILVTATMAFARPVHAATLLDVAQSPTELSAGNALTGAADGVGIVIGPAIAGVLYALIGPSPFLLLVGVSLGLAAIACRGLKQASSRA